MLSISSEEIAIRYIAETITTDPGRFGGIGPSQLLKSKPVATPAVKPWVGNGNLVAKAMVAHGNPAGRTTVPHGDLCVYLSRLGQPA